MSKIGEWLDDRFDKIRQTELVKNPEKSLKKIVQDSFPDLKELMNIICKWYDNKDVLDCFDTDDILERVDDYDIVEAAKNTIEWDNEMEAEVEAEISSRNLITWDEADEWLEEELNKRGTTYKDMTPDKVWEHFYDFLGIPYNNVNDAEVAFDDMCDKMARSTYAHEFIKNEIKK